MTSRPETRIKLGFTKKSGIRYRDLVSKKVPDLVLDDVAREIVDQDIALYVREELTDH